MSRLHEDPATRRVVDTDNPAYRVGVQSANQLIDTEFAKVPVYVLDAENLMAALLEEDPEVRSHWGMYLVLKGMLDTFQDYQRERST